MIAKNIGDAFKVMTLAEMTNRAAQAFKAAAQAKDQDRHLISVKVAA